MYIALVIESEDTLNREENSGNHEPGDTINNSRKHNLNSHQPDTRPPVSFDPRTVTILPFLVAQLASNLSLETIEENKTPPKLLPVHLPPIFKSIWIFTMKD